MGKGLFPPYTECKCPSGGSADLTAEFGLDVKRSSYSMV